MAVILYVEVNGMKEWTEQDEKKLQELLKTRKRLKQARREQGKRDDEMCRRLFGMTVSQIREALALKEVQQAEEAEEDNPAPADEAPNADPADELPDWVKES